MLRQVAGLSALEDGVPSPPDLTILIIEDDAGDYGLVEAELRHIGLELSNKAPCLIWAKTLAEGLTVGHKALPDVILLDLSLPDSFGTSTVESVVAAFPQVPIVVFTISDDDDLAITSLKAGAQDYLVKGQFDRYALKRALRYASIRSRMEQNLRLFESALNSAAYGVDITDSAGCIQWVNHAFTEMTGYNFSEVVGHTPGELLKSGVHDQAFYQQMWETILSGKIWRGEIVNRRKDGTLYDEMLSIAPVIDANVSGAQTA